MSDRLNPPFPQDHVFVIRPAGQFDERYSSQKRFPNGITPVFGVDGDTTDVQSLRFDSRQYSLSEARDWLEENDFAGATLEQEGRAARENPHTSGYGWPWSGWAAVAGLVTGIVLGQNTDDA